MSRALTAIVALLGAGCTFTDGDYFAVVDAHIHAELDRTDRDRGDGWLALDSGFEVRIDSLELEIGDLLVTSSQASADFDPANPPEGYSLCHNGHCHAADGSLVSYEDIAAMVGVGSGAIDLLALHLDAIRYDVPFDAALECEPECGLRTDRDLTGMRAPVLAVRASGLVRDTRVQPRLAGEQPWALDLGLDSDPVTLTTAVDAKVGRGEPSHIGLEIALPFSLRVVDSVLWDQSPAPDGVIDLSDSDNQSALVDGLGELTLTAAVDR